MLGTALSTLIVGVLMWWMLPLLGLSLPLAYCLVFGALISPTGSIAGYIGILKSAGAPESVNLVVSGESLFNDGVGVVLFSLLLAVATKGQVPTFSEGAMLLMHEAGGGLLLGAAIGAVLFMMLRSIDSYQVEVLLTLAGVLGGYELASKLHVSGPLAMVVAGLIVGNQGRAYAMSDTTRHHVDLFWEAALDEIFNAVLFVLLGLEIVVIAFDGQILLGVDRGDRDRAVRVVDGRRLAGGADAQCVQAARWRVESVHGAACAAASRWLWCCRCRRGHSASCCWR